MNNKILIILSAFMLASAGSFAQEDKKHKENFFGLGRAVVSNETLVDTTSTDKNATTNGYTLFDLGVQMERGDVFRAHAILRVRNEFGGFYGDGVSFDFRELRIEGLISKKIKYEIGDLDVSLTPYTIHNFEPVAGSRSEQCLGNAKSVGNGTNRARMTRHCLNRESRHPSSSCSKQKLKEDFSLDAPGCFFRL